MPNPVVDRFERATVEPVEPLASLVTDLDRSDRSEHRQVLGHLRLGQPQHADQVVHGPLPVARTSRICRRRRGFPAQAVSILVAPSRPSSATEVSRILNFCTLPVTVIGNSSTNRQ